MKQGQFQTEIDGIAVTVQWEGYYERASGMGGPWENSTPASGEMNILSVEMVGEWPEGLGDVEWNKLLQEAYDRLVQEAWDDLYERESE